jgi:hypothetical protein
MQWKSIFALVFIAPAIALIRFQCSQLVVERLDPLVFPGVSPTPHLHQIVGGVCLIRFQQAILQTNQCRTRSRHSWIPKKGTLMRHPVRLASSRRTSPTTGRPSCTSRPGTVHTNVSHRNRILALSPLSAARRFITCRTALSNLDLTLRSPRSSR